MVTEEEVDGMLAYLGENDTSVEDLLGGLGGRLRRLMETGEQSPRRDFAAAQCMRLIAMLSLIRTGSHLEWGGV